MIAYGQWVFGHDGNTLQFSWRLQILAEKLETYVSDVEERRAEKVKFETKCPLDSARKAEVAFLHSALS
jgi:hypothetical protein